MAQIRPGYRSGKKYVDIYYVDIYYVDITFTV